MRDLTKSLSEGQIKLPLRASSPSDFSGCISGLSLKYLLKEDGKTS